MPKETSSEIMYRTRPYSFCMAVPKKSPAVFVGGKFWVVRFSTTKNKNTKLAVHQGFCKELRLVQDEQFLVAFVFGDHEIIKYDAHTLQKVKIIRLEYCLLASEIISPMNLIFARVNNNELMLINIDSFNLFETAKIDFGSCLAANPTQDFLYFSMIDSPEADAMNVSDVKEPDYSLFRMNVKTLAVENLFKLPKMPYRIYFSKDGALIYFIWDEVLEIYSLAEKKQLHVIKDLGYVTLLMFHAEDEKFILMATDKGDIHVVSNQDYKLIKTVKTNTFEIVDMAVRGKHLVTLSKTGEIAYTLLTEFGVPNGPEVHFTEPESEDDDLKKEPYVPYKFYERTGIKKKFEKDERAILSVKVESEASKNKELARKKFDEDLIKAMQNS